MDRKQQVDRVRAALAHLDMVVRDIKVEQDSVDRDTDLGQELHVLLLLASNSASYAELLRDRLLGRLQF